MILIVLIAFLTQSCLLTNKPEDKTPTNTPEPKQNLTLVRTNEPSCIFYKYQVEDSTVITRENPQSIIDTLPGKASLRCTEDNPVFTVKIIPEPTLSLDEILGSNSQYFYISDSGRVMATAYSLDTIENVIDTVDSNCFVLNDTIATISLDSTLAYNKDHPPYISNKDSLQSFFGNVIKCADDSGSRVIEVEAAYHGIHCLSIELVNPPEFVSLANDSTFDIRMDCADSTGDLKWGVYLRGMGVVYDSLWVGN
ncbi:MAG: hypothetical protein HQK83_04625 [Fibrobacteria bacterium]|nr:hypothetical protein [Fibrobacteria bacterium]